MFSSDGEDADNTGRNERDRHGQSATPMDQSSSKDDVGTTRAIRQAITDDESLSTDAHNVKIITGSGRVVLRGPVESSAERDRVATIARKHAGANEVRNEIEVVND